MKKKVYLGIIIALILLVIGGYFGYKAYLLSAYKIDAYTAEIDSVVKSIPFKGTVSVSKDGSVTDYVSYGNMKIRNDFKDYKEDEQNGLKIYTLDDVATVSFGKTNSFVKLLKSDVSSNAKESKMNVREKYLEKNNIKNDFDYLNYLKDKKYEKINIFSSADEIKGRYGIVTMTMLPVADYYEITGDYTGFVMSADTIKQVHILGQDNDTAYEIVFSSKEKDYFTNEYVNELLNTLVIE